VIHKGLARPRNYTSIVYGLLTNIQQQKTVDIKLPVTITDAETMFSFSTLHKLHHKNYFLNSFLFLGTHKISQTFSWLFQHLSPNYGLFTAYKSQGELQDISGPVKIVQLLATWTAELLNCCTHYNENVASEDGS